MNIFLKNLIFFHQNRQKIVKKFLRLFEIFLDFEIIFVQNKMKNNGI